MRALATSVLAAALAASCVASSGDFRHAPTAVGQASGFPRCTPDYDRVIEHPAPALAPAAYCAQVAGAKQPVLVTEVISRYPEVACRQRRAGTVVLTVFVDPNGEVTKVDVASSAGSDLDSVAADAVSRTKFKPACRADGTPVGARLTYTYRFRLTVR